MALLSKIARLPRHIREELNRRMDDGEPGTVILPWINALPEVLKILAKHYSGSPVSDQNLSVWRETGLCEWQTNQERIHRIRALSEHAVNMSGQAEKLFSGSGAIAAGHIMELLESLDVEDQKTLLKGNGMQFTELLDKLARLTAAQTMQAKATLAREKQTLDKRKLDLEREKFEVLAATALLKKAQSKEIQKVVSGNGSHADKIAALRELMFPKRPAAAA